MSPVLCAKRGRRAGRGIAALCFLLLAGMADAAIINVTVAIDPSNLYIARREGPVTGSWGIGDTRSGNPATARIQNSGRHFAQSPRSPWRACAPSPARL